MRTDRLRNRLNRGSGCVLTGRSRSTRAPRHRLGTTISRDSKCTSGDVSGRCRKAVEAWEASTEAGSRLKGDGWVESNPGQEKRVLRRILVVLIILAGMATSLSPAGTRAQSDGGDWNGSSIANDGWRVEVVAVAQGESIGDAGLDTNAEGEWLLLVADVTNWTGGAATFPVTELSVSGAGGSSGGATGTVLNDLNLREGPGADAVILTGIPAGAMVEITGEAENGFYPVVFEGLEGYATVDGISVEGAVAAAGGTYDASASADAANALEATDGSDEIAADKTSRVTQAFTVAAGGDEPTLDFGTVLPLGDAIAAKTDLSKLVDVTTPELEELAIDGVLADGSVKLKDGTKIKLVGTETPKRGACYSQSATKELEQLTVGRITLERMSDTGADPVAGYLWRENGGKRELVNQKLVAAGAADASFDGQDDRLLEAWLTATRDQAKEDETGLWGECTGFNGDDRPEPTVAPSPTADAAEVRGEYPVLSDVREIAIRPGSYIGDKVQFTGRIFNIQVASAGQIATLGDQRTYQVPVVMQVYVVAPDGSEEAVFIGYDGDTTGMFEDTYVSIYGTVVGTQSGTNGFGGGITQPLVIADIIELA